MKFVRVRLNEIIVSDCKQDGSEALRMPIRERKRAIRRFWEQ